MKLKYNVEIVELKDIDDKKAFVVKGWIITKEENVKAASKINGIKHVVKLTMSERKDVFEKYKNIATDKNCGFEAVIELAPELTFDNLESFILAFENKEDKVAVLKYNKKDIERVIEVYNEKYMDIYFNISGGFVDANSATVIGWAMDVKRDEPVKINIYDSNRKKIESKVTYVEREDVITSLAKDNKNPLRGFNVIFEYNYKKTYYIVFKSGEARRGARLPLEKYIDNTVNDYKIKIEEAKKNTDYKVSFIKEIKNRVLKMKKGEVAYLESEYADMNRYAVVNRKNTGDKNE